MENVRPTCGVQCLTKEKYRLWEVLDRRLGGETEAFRQLKAVIGGDLPELLSSANRARAEGACKQRTLLVLNLIVDKRYIVRII